MNLAAFAEWSRSRGHSVVQTFHSYWVEARSHIYKLSLNLRLITPFNWSSKF